MSSKKDDRRQPLAIRTAIALLATLALAGLVLIGNGLYIKAKAELSQALLNRSFERRVQGLGDGRPWPWADFQVVARISTPRLAKRGIVIAGVSATTRSLGPAWLEASPLPGDNGTSVIAANSDSQFAWIGNLRRGDTIHIELADGRALDFRATGTRIARWDDNGIDVSALGRHLALTTCWPLDGTAGSPFRYVVDADLIDIRQPMLASAR
ncbi:class GN sortase [Rhizobium sp. C1]|uniref:class GN sortase n=1 Tax=Rhizobium sp. C1 TaxID=1349799 RepID=UPI001E326AA1|nr:class GN sortase [Rhizobium sp. C1]MCD2176389.1 class GN sortase [Rhizobium sp. C1]